MVQWMTVSGTWSSDANAWISACSTTTADYPRGLQPRARRIAVSMRAISPTASVVGRWPPRSAVPGTVERGAAASRVRACSSDRPAIVAGLAVERRPVAVRVDGVEKPIEQIVERFRIEAIYLPPTPLAPPR